MEQQRNSKGQYLPGSGAWEEGESGNPSGRPKNSVTTLLKNKSHEDNQKIADKLYALALAGDMSAIREYIDRTDGKVTEKHVFAGLIGQVTPEILETAQNRLTGALSDTHKLIEEHKEV